ncbi:MAG TPA: isochorismatase family cysteine hydrolase [Bacilli bacterium]|nr:isochorismatase family cysteine hydrolase [Bacilli bacterium]
MNKKYALIVVDMVYDFTNPNGKIFYPLNVDLLPKIKDFIAEVRKYGVQIIYMQHSVTKRMLEESPKKTRECCLVGTKGEQIDERLEIRPEDLVIKKHKYSSFFETGLDQELKSRGIDHIIVAGTKTNNCVFATVLDAYNLNYHAFVPKELVGTTDYETNGVYLRDMGKYLCEVMSDREIIAHLQEGIL